MTCNFTRRNHERRGDTWPTLTGFPVAGRGSPKQGGRTRAPHASVSSHASLAETSLERREHHQGSATEVAGAPPQSELTTDRQPTVSGANRSSHRMGIELLLGGLPWAVGAGSSYEGPCPRPESIGSVSDPGKCRPTIRRSTFFGAGSADLFPSGGRP
jgi:hypothetical protein